MHPIRGTLGSFLSTSLFIEADLWKLDNLDLVCNHLLGYFGRDESGHHSILVSVWALCILQGFWLSLLHISLSTLLSLSRIDSCCISAIQILLKVQLQEVRFEEIFALKKMCHISMALNIWNLVFRSSKNIRKPNSHPLWCPQTLGIVCWLALWGTYHWSAKRTVQETAVMR